MCLRPTRSRRRSIEPPTTIQNCSNAGWLRPNPNLPRTRRGSGAPSAASKKITGRGRCFEHSFRGNLSGAGASNASKPRISTRILPRILHRILHMALTQARQNAAEASSDEDLVRMARERDEAAVRAITKRYNRRLFRIARSILRNDAEAEDVVPETYVRAFTGLDMFRGDAAFGTWIT